MMKGAKMLKDAGVPFTAYSMAGFPGETDEDLMETIEFAKVKDDYYSLSVVAPYYGTKMYYDLIDDGVQLDKKPWEYFHQTGDNVYKDSKKVLEKFLRLNELNNNNGYS